MNSNQDSPNLSVANDHLGLKLVALHLVLLKQRRQRFRCLRQLSLDGEGVRAQVSRKRKGFLDHVDNVIRLQVNECENIQAQQEEIRQTFSLPWHLNRKQTY